MSSASKGNDGFADPGELASLGETYVLEDPGVAFKLYPLCSSAQAAAEITQRMLTEHKIDGADVTRVLCEVTPFVKMCLRYDDPSTPTEAQFSMPFAIGGMLAMGIIGLFLGSVVLAVGYEILMAWLGDTDSTQETAVAE